MRRLSLRGAIVLEKPRPQQYTKRLCPDLTIESACGNGGIPYVTREMALPA